MRLPEAATSRSILHRNGFASMRSDNPVHTARRAPIFRSTMPTMTMGGLLPDTLLRDLHDAAIAANLDRAALVARIDRRLVTSFRTATSPGAQIWEDLSALNDIPALADGSVPLRTWLETAKHRAEPRREAVVFQRTLDVLDGKPTAAPHGPPTPAPAARDAAPPAPATRLAPPDQVDILLITVLPDEYAAVLRVLSNARQVPGTPDAPNLYGWRLGTIARTYGGAYRVALALTGSAGTVIASQAVVRSAERWRPRYVLLVGIAGGLSLGGCAPGDVVVSTEIYGYEYGKLDRGFHPRANWTYQVDRGLLTSVQAFAAANPDWWTGDSPAPKVLFGPVASGEKVVDDPSDPSFAAVLHHWPKLQAVEMEGAGAAAAIEELRAVGSHAIGFLMLRGISDMPRPPSARAEGAAAQTAERDANKRRACDVAAAFAVRWIAAEWPVEPREPEPPSSAALHALLPLPIGSRRALRLPGLATMQKYWQWLARREYPTLAMTECLRRVSLPIRLIRPEVDHAERASLEVHDGREKRRGDSFEMHRTNRSHETAEARFDVAIRNELRRHSKVLVLGDSGSGKTTLLRRLAEGGAKRLLARGFRKRSRPTPVLVELWRFGDERSLKELILAAIAESACGLQREEVDLLLERGCLLLLLDGLDEVPLDNRRECLAQIGALSQEYPKLSVVVSSRQLPSLPRDYGVLVIGLLNDGQIAAAIDVFLPRGDLRIDDYRTAEEYVRLVLRPSVRSLCRRPLTLAFVLSALDAGKALPKNLFQTYDQLMHWTLAWEFERDELPSVLQASEVLQGVSYALCSREALHIPVLDWVSLAAPMMQRLRTLGLTIDPEYVLRKTAAIGLLRFHDGNVGFAHRSVQEFLAAKYLVERTEKPHEDPIAVQPGVAEFLCSSLPDATALLERHLSRCSDVGELFPLLDECFISETPYGRFEDLRNAMVTGYDMGIHVTHGMIGSDAAVFIDEIEYIVETAVEFGRQALSVLKAAIDGIIFGAMWREGRSWLECLASGLERLGWRGVELLRAFLSLGYFEHGEWIFHPRDEGPNSKSETPFEFMNFFEALQSDDWDSAAVELATLRTRAEAWLADSDAVSKHQRHKKRQDNVGERDDVDKSTDASPREPGQGSRKCNRCDGLVRPIPHLLEKFELVDLVGGVPCTLQIERQRYCCPCGATVDVAPCPERTSPGSRYSLRFTIRAAIEAYSEATDIPCLSVLDLRGQDDWNLLNILGHRLEPAYRELSTRLLSHSALHISLTAWPGSKSNQMPPWPMWRVSANGIVVYRLSAPRKKSTLAGMLRKYTGALVFDDWVSICFLLDELRAEHVGLTMPVLPIDLLQTHANRELERDAIEQALTSARTWARTHRRKRGVIGMVANSVLSGWRSMSKQATAPAPDRVGLLLNNAQAQRSRYGPFSARDVEIAAIVRSVLEAGARDKMAPDEYLYTAAMGEALPGSK